MPILQLQQHLLKKNILLSEEHLVVQWSNKDIVSYICFGNLF